MRNVAIYCGPAWEQFSPADIELRGLGGSETAAIRLAEHLSHDLDLEVTVYGEVLEGCVRGVTYRDWRTFDPDERRAAVISSRNPEIADAIPNARVRMLWVHDADYGERLTPERAEQFDYVLCLSDWHRRHLADAYPFCADKLRQIRNGVELAYFDGPVVERVARVLSTSPPDRGLDILLELWPDIQARVPAAELAYAYPHVYERIADDRPPLRAQIERIQELSAQDRVTSFGSLPQPELARLMQQSLVWVHPSFATTYGGPAFETSCIGAMEAQAAGCVVVASDWGALPETVKVGRLVGGEPGSEAWRAALVDEVADALTSADTQAWAQREGPVAAAALGWQPVARAVAELIPGDQVIPASARPTICLNMIVRDEAHVVRETLDSVASHIDCLVVVDTGSSDGTIDTIRRWMADNDLRGEIHQRPWRDFGANRTEAMKLAQGWADYIWVIDADDLLVGDPDLSALRADSYLVSYRDAIRYWRKQIFRDGLPWRYEGVVHEYPVCDDPATEERLSGAYHIVSRRLGARNRSPDKYQRDAMLLRKELERDSEDARAVFYLAQSCFDAGDYAEALRWYRRRAEMGGFAEEVFYSLMRCAECRSLQNEPWERALAASLAAYQARPVRAESLYAIARHYRQADEFNLGYLFARQAAEMAEPNDLLFVDTAVYEWKAVDELALCAYYTGRYDESFALCSDLLASTTLPETERERIVTNREFCVSHLEAGHGEEGGGAETHDPGGSGDRPRRLPELALQQLRIEAEPDWPCTAASVASTDGRLTAAVRTSAPGAAPSGPLNYLVEFDEQLVVKSVQPLVDPEERFFDELRLVARDRRLYAVGVEHSESGQPRSVTLRLDGSRIRDVSLIAMEREGAAHAPFVEGSELRLVVAWSPTRVLDADDGALVSERPAPPMASGFGPGSNGVEIGSGWLFVVASSRHHRFVLLDRTLSVTAASAPFSIAGGSHESCRGLARRGEDLILAFGFENRTAGLAFLPMGDALALLEPC